MSTEAHTPGPWVVTSRAGYTGHGVSSRGTRVCSINSNSRVDESQRDANARLIAAAPVMLASLKDLIAEIDDLGEIPQQLSAATLTKARQIIVLAEAGAAS